jgi:hypothetical protein
MAISKTHYEILRELRQRNLLQLYGSVLEIGQATFYDDMDPAVILADVREFVPAERQADCEALFYQSFEKRDLLGMARLIYRVLFLTDDVDAIDIGGTGPRCQSRDLNEPTTTGRYQTVINHGTAEHVFNIANVFKVMHDATAYGGLMLHESPFTGWVNHGFYCLQPTLFYDVARANSYQVVGVWIEHMASQTYQAVDSHEHIVTLAQRGHIPHNSMLFVALRKYDNVPFKIPQQGVYAGASEAITRAWFDLR